MIVFESRKARRVLARFERGEELVASLAKLAKDEKVRSAWVRGVGALEWAELDRHDQARRVPEPPQRFDTPCDLLTLDGHVSLEDGEPTPTLYVTLSRRTDNGLEVIGGRLVRGGVFGVELSIEVLGDLRLERVEDDRTGLAVWAGPTRPGAEAKPRAKAKPTPEPAAPKSAAPSKSWTMPADEDEDLDEDEDELDDLREGGAPAAAPSGGVSWADVAAVSAAPEVAQQAAPPRRKRKKRGAEAPTPDFRPPPIPEKRAKTTEAEFMDEPTPQKGDFIQHRQFGLCRVDREDGQGGIVIKLPSGVRKTIKLDYMEVGAPRMEGKKRVYPVRPRRR